MGFVVGCGDRRIMIPLSATSATPAGVRHLDAMGSLPLPIPCWGGGPGRPLLAGRLLRGLSAAYALGKGLLNAWMGRVPATQYAVEMTHTHPKRGGGISRAPEILVMCRAQQRWRMAPPGRTDRIHAEILLDRPEALETANRGPTFEAHGPPFHFQPQWIPSRQIDQIHERIRSPPAGPGGTVSVAFVIVMAKGE